MFESREDKNVEKILDTRRVCSLKKRWTDQKIEEPRKKKICPEVQQINIQYSIVV